MTDDATGTPLTAHDVFVQLHAGLPRQAPGSDATTRLLADLAGPIGPDSRITDLGCGPGRASLVLAAHTGAAVTAIDLHRPFLDELDATARQRGLAERITTLAASFADLPLDDGSCDVVWAEGSAYVIGFDTALHRWRRLLAPGGVVVLTECEWNVTDPHPEAAAFWSAYPGMRTTAANVAAAMAAGWRVEAVLVLPDSDWDEYYEALAARLAGWEGQVDDAIAAVLDATAAELDCRHRFADQYSYTAYVLRPAGAS